MGGCGGVEGRARVFGDGNAGGGGCGVRERGRKSRD